MKIQSLAAYCGSHLRAGSALLLMAAILLAAAADPAPARAFTLILVDTTDGGLVDGSGLGDCSLAEAITNANLNSGLYADCDSGAANDTITFADGLGAATISLSAALPTIYDSAGLTILGGGDITIDGAGLYRVFYVTGNAVIKDLIVQHGAADGGAGALLTWGSLRIVHSTFVDNHTSGDDSIYAGGGGVSNFDGTLVVDGSTFIGNTTVGQGGAIYNSSGTAGGTATIINSTFSSNSASGGSAGNRGGAVFNGFGFPAAIVYVYDSTFSGNYADSANGAGIHVHSGNLYMYNTIIANNPTGYDCYFAGTTVDGGNNLIEDGAGACTFMNGIDGNIIGSNPDLKPATGSPAYFPLSAYSLALDAGDNAQVPGGVSTDQAGNSRFADVSWAPDTGSGFPDVVDIGAYESQLSCPPGGQVYVDADATAGSKNGHSWANAFTDLQTGIDVDDNCVGATATWVAEGVYKPGTNQTDRFTVPSGVAVYGGFAGTENLIGQRNWINHPTILSADIDNNDITTNNVVIDPDNIVGYNSSHVLFLDGSLNAINADTTLDGFTITAGDANGSFPNGDAGGLFCNASGGGTCSPTLTHLVFRGNRALYAGAISIYAASGGTASPKLIDVTFRNNKATQSGGAMNNVALGPGSTTSPSLTDVTFRDNHANLGSGAVFNYGSGTSSPEFKRVTFVGNGASYGGAMINQAGGGVVSPQLENVTFVSNTAVNDGGAVYNIANSGGSLSDGSTSLSLTNVTFTGNSATNGGAIGHDVTAPSTSSTTLKNVILWNNTASTGPEIDHTSGGTSTLDYALVQGGCPSGSSCTNLISSDPLLAALQNNGGLTETMRLPAGSPAIEAGTNTGCPATDARGEGRPQDGDQNGTPTCDLGAYEFALQTISGFAGVGGAGISYTGGSTAADGSGLYSFDVPEGWDGTVTPSKTNFIFTPDHRDYTDVMVDQANQNYAAFAQAPTIARVYPADGSTACFKPKVGVGLLLAALVRTSGGSFDPTTVTLKLDGTTVTGSATINESGASLSMQATMLYTPTSNLSAGSHQGSFIYPTAGGPATYNWGFNVANITCGSSAQVETPATETLTPTSVESPSSPVGGNASLASSAAQNAYRRLIQMR